MKQYDAYLSSFLEAYAFSLLPNHFHFLISVKAKKDFEVGKNFPSLGDLESLSEGQIVSELFRRFFMGYNKSINIQQTRNGSLFQKNFRRKHIANDAYLNQVIYYIHHQLQHHNFHGLNDQNYPWNSYQRILSDKPSRLMKREVLNWFGSKENYIEFHRMEQNLNSIEGLMIER